MVPTGFPSWRSYFSFAVAREFTGGEHRPNLIERIGDVLSYPVFRPLNSLFQNITNPLVLTALVVAGIALTTLLFYPAQFIAAVQYVLPFIARIESWMLRFVLFAAIETAILGIGLRALGRMCNEPLKAAWINGNLEAHHIGSFR